MELNPKTTKSRVHSTNFSFEKTQTSRYCLARLKSRNKSKKLKTKTC